MKYLLTAVLMFGLAACAQAPAADAPAPPSQSASAAASECTARGGRIERVGRAQTEQCVIRYADAGRACTDGSQCQAGACLGSVEAAHPPGGSASGQCRATNMAFGCYTRITNGRAEAALCVD